MAEEKVEVSINGLSRLQSAARDFARAEIDRIVQAVVRELGSHPAVGIFGDVHARHMWDEYCWALQEGPFDDPSDLKLGSPSDGFNSLAHAFVLAEVEKLPRYAQIFVSAIAFEEDDDSDEEASLGNLWIEGIVKVVTEAVNERASRRNLDLIGPDRADVIGYEIQGTGFVWSLLDSTEAINLVTGHVDSMVDPDADLSLLADEMAEAFLATVRADEDGYLFPEFPDRFKENLRSMVMEQDVLPSLKQMRRNLLETLDR